MVSQSSKHTFDLVVLSLLQADQRPGVPQFRQGCRFCRQAEAAVSQGDAGLKRIAICSRKRTCQSHQIVFGNMSLGGEHAVRQGTVCGQQHQPLRVLVQSAGGKKSLALEGIRHQFQYGWIPCILGCTDIAGRLVEQQITTAGA